MCVCIPVCVCLCVHTHTHTHQRHAHAGAKETVKPYCGYYWHIWWIISCILLAMFLCSFCPMVPWRFCFVCLCVRNTNECMCASQSRYAYHKLQKSKLNKLERCARTKACFLGHASFVFSDEHFQSCQPDGEECESTAWKICCLLLKTSQQWRSKCQTRGRRQTSCKQNRRACFQWQTFYVLT